MPREVICDNVSEAFIKTGNNKCKVILNCAEVFIERPKSPDCQVTICSDYKRHITIKFLIGISPSGFITFLSSCYCGQASDKFIIKDSGFYDLLECEDVVMVDRGFHTQEDLSLYFCNLQVPPDARTKSQVTKKRYKRQMKFQIYKVKLREQLIG